MKKALFLALAALTSSVLAEPAAHIDVTKLPTQSKMIDDVVVPVPSEIFAVLDKLGKPNWVAVQHKMNGVVQAPSEQPQIALLLGVVIAEGFIAVEAEDAAEVKQIGKSVLNLTKALGVQKKAQMRAKAITDAAEAKDWPGVRKQLDKALDDVSDAMKELNSVELSHLVSLGGWLRGTEALTVVVEKQYTKDGAELLHQPILLDAFEKRLANLKPKRKLNPVVNKVQKGVLEIRPLMGLPESGDISEKSVKEIGAITSALVKEITSKSQP
ncbi:MAG: hypothetical protein K8R23_18670 [Chthoniobacter sp.]|nr:hypothetical protein [Chthoniobacter sp.]